MRHNKIKTFEDINNAVEANEGVVTLTMAQVRDVYGVTRLGPHVVDNISNSLRGVGLGHFPYDLPIDQGEQIRVYKLGSGIDRLINAAHQVGSKHDEILKSAAAIGKDAKILEQIRDLVY